MSRGQEPDEVDENGVHLVAHEPGECRLGNLYQQGRSHVVRILTPVDLGAGVVITADGRVVTNDHVVETARRITVETHDGVTWRNIERRNYFGQLVRLHV